VGGAEGARHENLRRKQKLRMDSRIRTPLVSLYCEDIFRCSWKCHELNKTRKYDYVLGVLYPLRIAGFESNECPCSAGPPAVVPNNGENVNHAVNHADKQHVPTNGEISTDEKSRVANAV